MKVFITGISGFLGSHIAESLHQQGHEIYALLRKTSKRNHLSIPFHPVEGELPHLKHLAPLLSQMDAVVHVAGKIKALSPEEFHETNALGTLNLAKACLQASAKPKIFLYISTIAVIDPIKDGGNFCKSSEECHPISWYGDSKLEGEKSLKILKDQMRIVTLRPPVLYGPRDEEMLTLFKAVHKGFAPLFQKGENELSVCYIKDVADCVISLLENPPEQDEIYCLDDGDKYTWKSLAAQVAQSMNKKISYIPIPAFLFQTGAFFTELYAKIFSKPQIFTRNKIKEMKQKSWVCGSEKLQKTRNWTAKTKLPEGAKITYEFYQKNRWL